MGSAILQVHYRKRRLHVGGSTFRVRFGSSHINFFGVGDFFFLLGEKKFCYVKNFSWLGEKSILESWDANFQT
jgi:hypothetical protein